MHELHAETMARLIRDVCPSQCTGVEVGVFRGVTSAYLLRELPGLELLWLVDRWDAEPFKLDRNRFSLMSKHSNGWHAGNQVVAAKAVAFARDRVEFVRADFREAAKLIRDESLDFCFLDAAHSEKDTWDQIEIYSPKIKPGGLIAGHDYGFPSSGYECVAAAVDRWVAEHQLELHVEDGYVWWYQQPFAE